MDGSGAVAVWFGGGNGDVGDVVVVVVCRSRLSPKGLNVYRKQRSQDTAHHLHQHRSYDTLSRGPGRPAVGLWKGYITG